MLTEWERRQLAEIERGLAEDFARRRRLRRRLARLGRFNPASAAVLLICVGLLINLGAWSTALSLAVVYALFAGARALRHGFHRRHDDPEDAREPR